MNKTFSKIAIAILVMIPFTSQLLVLPLVNRIDPILMGLPFLHFWLFMWILLSPLCTYGVYRIQKSQRGLT